MDTMADNGWFPRDPLPRSDESEVGPAIPGEADDQDDSSMIPGELISTGSV
jgi:hypothetical protein